MKKSSVADKASPQAGQSLREGVSRFVDCTHRVQAGHSLSAVEAERMMVSIVRGIVPDECIGHYLTALADKGESVAEIVGSARALRAHAIPFSAPGGPIDNCGTGGDGTGTFNISTVAALVIASTGQPVVKHGNRSASGRVGSADLMEALGVRIDLEPEASGISYRRFHFAFLFAPQYHPAAKIVAPLRRRLGRPTLFNLMGPLCNPAKPAHQLLGTAGRPIAHKISEAVLGLGIKRAFVVTGGDGVDELIPNGPNDVFVVEGGQVSRTSFSAHHAGLNECSLADLQGGDVRHNAALAMEILRGAPGPPRDAVIFNAGAALLCCGAVSSLEDGVARCASAVDRGESQILLEALRAFSREQGVHGG